MAGDEAAGHDGFREAADGGRAQHAGAEEKAASSMTDSGMPCRRRWRSSPAAPLGGQRFGVHCRPLVVAQRVVAGVGGRAIVCLNATLSDRCFSQVPTRQLAERSSGSSGIVMLPNTSADC